MGKGFNELPKQVKEHVRGLVEKPENYPYDFVDYSDQYLQSHPMSTETFKVTWALRMMEMTERDVAAAQNTADAKEAQGFLDRARALNEGIFKQADEYRAKIACEKFLEDIRSGDEAALAATNPIDTAAVRARIADAYQQYE